MSRNWAHSKQRGEISAVAQMQKAPPEWDQGAAECCAGAINLALLAP